MMFWIVAGLVSITLLYFLIVKPFNEWKYRCVPQYHFLISLRETLLGFISYRAISEVIQKTYNDFPDLRYVGMYLLTKPILFVRDANLIKQITVKDFDHFVDHFQIFPDNSEHILTKNLFQLKGHEWRKMRSTLSPSFTNKKMKVVFGLISDYSKLFLAYFEDQKCETISLEMTDVFTRFTNDAIATWVFGINCDSMRNPNNEFYITGKSISNFNGILTNLKFLLVMMLPKLANVEMLKIKLFSKQTSFFIKRLKEIMESREKSGIVRQDMIHWVIEARKCRSKHDRALDRSLDTKITFKEGSTEQKEEKHQNDQLTADVVIAQVFLLFFGGINSVTTLMSFMAYELAVNVEVQERLQTEIDETLQRCNGNLTYEALAKMKYMDMVIEETLRKWPPSVANNRVCTKPYTIQPVEKGEAPVNLRVGDLLWIPVFGLHRDPKIFSEPERFDPERFSIINKAKISPYCYMPFGVGPRVCIADRFAFMETKLAFFYILSTFHLTVNKKTPVPLQVSKNQIQLAVKGKLWIDLKRRN